MFIETLADIDGDDNVMRSIDFFHRDLICGYSGPENVEKAVDEALWEMPFGF